jgi:hypothetical protein
MLTNEMLQQVIDEPEKLELLRQFNVSSLMCSEPKFIVHSGYW